MPAFKISVSEEVRTAQSEGRPVVALESTIISHGMPYPRNYETAQEVEAIVRAEGAVPATIAVVNGRPRVGLTDSEMDILARPDSKVLKLSTRDIPYACAVRAQGATTVAATMVLAYRAGLEIFVTGGIGGVHRGASESFDVSADLLELSRTPITVICAGAKAILDIPGTLELLESNGVGVYGYKTDHFPAFYYRMSGYRVEHRVDKTKDLARILLAKSDLELPGGVLVANPIPKEAALDKVEIEKVIAEALQEAERRKIRGKNVTPFLLSAVVTRTQGRSLDANIALIKNNAVLGARLAVSLASERGIARTGALHST